MKYGINFLMIKLSNAVPMFDWTLRTVWRFDHDEGRGYSLYEVWRKPRGENEGKQPKNSKVFSGGFESLRDYLINELENA